jgi:hypothetical protein
MSMFCRALVCFFVAVPAIAQSQAFEKITIKPVRSVDPRSMRLQILPDGELIAHADLVISLISYAYDVPSNPSPRLNSLPDWIYEDRYDIDAKASLNVITTTSQDGETQLRVKQMIRRLLADRFGLVMRVNRQRMPAYAMTVSSNGIRLQRSRFLLRAYTGEAHNAMVTTQYGPPDVLQLREIATPVPAEDEVLIKLYASSVNPLDSFVIRGPLFFVPMIGRLLKPKHKIAGADIAGRVESVGRDVKQFRPGDEVFGASFGKRGLGGFAEYACAVEDSLARKPANLSFEDAAAVPVAAITALQGLRDKGRIQRGQKVLVDGASGGVGTFAIQIAKSFGAEVTAVCSPRNVDTGPIHRRRPRH